MTFPKTVSKSLKQSGLSDREFSDKLGISKATLWRWKTGKSQPNKNAIAMWINKINGE